METPEKSVGWSRRDFSRLTAAAFGGVVLGSLASGCQSPDHATGDASPTMRAPAGSKGAIMLQEPHVCRGLNTCQGRGAAGNNECAGMGQCATAEHHGCHGQNACQGQGGCGATAGQNSCKGEGNCGVPLQAGTWEKARAAFEKQAAASGMKVGPAPGI